MQSLPEAWRTSYLLRFAQSGHMLHSLLSFGEFCVLLSGICAVGSYLKRRKNGRWPTQLLEILPQSIAIPAKSVIYEAQSLAVKASSRLSTTASRIKVRLRVQGILPVWTEEEEARNIRKQLEEHIVRRPDRQGFSYIWSLIILAVLAASWGGWMWLAVHDHNQIVALREQIRSYEEEQRIKDTPPEGLETWHALKVTERSKVKPAFHALTLNPTTHEWVNAFYEICPKPDGTAFDLDSEIQPGVTILSITWRVDRIRGCKCMNSRLTGHSLWRKPDGQLMLSDWKPEGRQSTSPEQATRSAE